MDEKKKLDEIDIKILDSCKEHDGSNLKVVIKPLLGQRSYKTLYARLMRLELFGYVSLDREKFRGRTLCSVTKEGLEELGRMTAQPKED